MDLLKKINIEYSQYKKYLYKKLTTYTMISIKNKVKSKAISTKARQYTLVAKGSVQERITLRCGKGSPGGMG